MVNPIFLHTGNTLTMLSRVNLVIIPFRPEMVNSPLSILHFTLTAAQKVNQTYMFLNVFSIRVFFYKNR